MSWIQAPSGLITPHFSWHEMACRHCGEIPEVAAVQKTAAWLEEVRTQLGDHPMHISSGCRCKLHNAAIGGEPNSYHLLGWAVDITVRDLSPPEVHRRCKAMQRSGLIGGIGRYRAFTHVDRGPVRSWSGY